ncbi:MAG: hypothetical protein L7V29_05185 [Alphaproteobacteria bacterium]|nr:hypothetical protein [Alphaproteobacteria bacterium]
MKFPLQQIMNFPKAKQNRISFQVGDEIICGKAGFKPEGDGFSVIKLSQARAAKRGLKNSKRDKK